MFTVSSLLQNYYIVGIYRCVIFLSEVTNLKKKSKINV